jgi:hypothetical protein
MGGYKSMATGRNLDATMARTYTIRHANAQQLRALK